MIHRRVISMVIRVRKMPSACMTPQVDSATAADGKIWNRVNVARGGGVTRGGLAEECLKSDMCGSPACACSSGSRSVSALSHGLWPAAVAVTAAAILGVRKITARK